MNTREREVMDALANELRSARDSVCGELVHERAAFKGYEGSSNIAQLEAELVAIDSALAAYDALLAEGSGERTVLFGDSPAIRAYADYLAEGSASSEGAEAVGEIVSRSDGGMDVQWSPDYNPSPGDRFYTCPQPAQGEHEQRSCEPAGWLNVIGELSDTKRNSDDEAVGVRAAALIRGLEQRSAEGSERRPIADGSQVLRDALHAYFIELGRHGGHISALRAALESAHPRGLPAVPNDDGGHEHAQRHGVFIYEVDFGDEGKGRYIRLRDFNRVCERGLPAGSDAPVPGVIVDKEGVILVRKGREDDFCKQRGAERLYRRSAIAEQPSCGQDARRTSAIEDAFYEAQGDIFTVYTHWGEVSAWIMARKKEIEADAYAAIAAQQRHGGA